MQDAFTNGDQWYNMNLKNTIVSLKIVTTYVIPCYQYKYYESD